MPAMRIVQPFIQWTQGSLYSSCEDLGLKLITYLQVKVHPCTFTEALHRLYGLESA